MRHDQHKSVLVMSYSSATPQKQAHIDENYHTPACTPHTPHDIFWTPLQPLPTSVNINPAVNFAGFVDGDTPVPKQRKIARVVTWDELAWLGREWWAWELQRGWGNRMKKGKGAGRRNNYGDAHGILLYMENNYFYFSMHSSSLYSIFANWLCECPRLHKYYTSSVRCHTTSWLEPVSLSLKDFSEA